MTLAKRFLLGSAATIALSLAANGAFAQDLRFWTTEEQPDRLAKQEELAAAFEAETVTLDQLLEAQRWGPGPPPRSPRATCRT